VLLASLSLLGCAAGQVTRSAPLAAFAPVSEAPARLQPKRAALEATSRAEGAAFFSHEAVAKPQPAAAQATLATPAPAPKDRLEERVAALLNTTDRCPADMAFVDGRVCVDRWEASLVELVAGGERAWSPYVPVDGHEGSVRAVSRPGVVPQGYISGHQGQLACQASGKRLCSGGEWERACRGPSKTQFPYGQERRTGACNDDIRPVHPVPEAGVLLGITAGSLWSEGMNQAIINQLPDTLLPTGERAECTNDYGVFDMVGNLHEWVDDPDGTFRGGYYMDTSHNGEGCSYATTAHDFTYHDYSTGFRCCMDPEPVE
jgi:formylglycine-generating enzyme